MGARESVPNAIFVKVSVYSEMLRIALEQDEDDERTDPAEPADLAGLISRAITCRARLSADGDVAARLAGSLAYDVALIRLCERIQLSHDMLGTRAGPVARQETEQRLAGRLPSLAAFLGGLEP